MRSGQARLAIDYGSADTTAVLAWPDGTWTPLLFDGEPALPSAVLLSGDGTTVTGHHAWRAAPVTPHRFIPHPRQPSEQRLTVADTDVDPLDLVAATLRHVAGQAHQLAWLDINRPSAETRITNWGVWILSWVPTMTLRRWPQSMAACPRPAIGRAHAGRESARGGSICKDPR
ncbi:hypothetical protein CSH63_05810 [Micromonospora tulbaghiae]|uniref:Uncharacterized protein n=1 Tax=Micromonospora tulbaghiae TaxID=479978 RepID=A0A386WF88_9ACTN|nr:hypothetical protein [Micromonospora tulbaghiae]AYF26957.1 hypothetical protein CSH63_05810 [Micromonospora tulbaghiae]